jgi:hypothetical protein
MWSDKETAVDCLGFTSYVDVLAEICVHEDLAPLTLGVFGSWGSGKTSLMRMLMDHIERPHPERTEVLWFNAWRYEGREEAQSALIHAILNRLKSKQTLVDEAKQLFDRLKKGASVLKLSKAIARSALTMTPDIGGFIDCLQDESEKVAETIESFEADFTKLLSVVKVDRIIVFIDDLDRCSSSKIIETFETIKLFLNTPSCTFVIGADAARIEQAVGEVYSVAESSRRKDYIEKIVQIPFNIPQQSIADIACYVGMLVLLQALKEPGIRELAKSRPAFVAAEVPLEEFLEWHRQNASLFVKSSGDIPAELAGIVPYVAILARGLRGNPRQVKRFLNVLALRRRLAHANVLDVRQDLLVKLGVLEYVWSDFFVSLAETVDPNTGFSPLIAEMLASDVAEVDSKSDSKLLAESLSTSGLLDFLRDEPEVNGTLDLRPYLFLAQTSLSRGQIGDVLPINEQVNVLVRNVESDDRLISQAGARHAAASEAAIAEAVVRALVSDLPSVPNALRRTHIVTGLQAICRKHRSQFPAALKAIEHMGPSDPASSLSATTLIQEARAAGIPIPDGLESRFAEASILKIPSRTPRGKA